MYRLENKEKYTYTHIDLLLSSSQILFLRSPRKRRISLRIDYRLIQFYWNKQLAYLPRAQCGAPIARQKYKVAVKWS